MLTTNAALCQNLFYNMLADNKQWWRICESCCCSQLRLVIAGWIGNLDSVEFSCTQGERETPAGGVWTPFESHIHFLINLVAHAYLQDWWVE